MKTAREIRDITKDVEDKMFNELCEKILDKINKIYSCIEKAANNALYSVVFVVEPVEITDIFVPHKPEESGYLITCNKYMYNDEIIIKKDEMDIIKKYFRDMGYHVTSDNTNYYRNTLTIDWRL